MKAAGHSCTTKANIYLSTFSVRSGASAPAATRAQAVEALIIAGGNKSQAAQTLGISRQALYRLLARQENTA